MPVYRELGGGDAMKGFEETYKMTYQELNAKLHESVTRTLFPASTVTIRTR